MFILQPLYSSTTEAEPHLICIGPHLYSPVLSGIKLNIGSYGPVRQLLACQ